MAAKEGEIRLVYLDEAGCCLESPVSYTYVQVNEQKRLEQAIKTYGHRISILGVWEENEHFDYALAQGGFRSESYIKVMDWIAQKAQTRWQNTGQITVVVQDNGSLHKSNVVREHWSSWQEKGLYLFFLPPYCSEMNIIESQWHQLKTHEISGQIFDNEYDLALAIIKGVEARSQTHDYTTERFIFNST